MAIDQKAPVMVSDIGQDARWDNFEWSTLALAVGLRSCWTTPILSQAGTPLGTFAIYQREVGSPTPLQTDLIGRFTHIASIAIERAQAEEALRRSQAQLARAQRLSTTGSFSYRAATDELTLSEETCRICGFDPGQPVPPGAMRDRIHPEDLPLFLSMLGGTGSQFEFDCRVQLQDGTIRYLHVVADAVRDDAAVSSSGSAPSETSPTASARKTSCAEAKRFSPKRSVSVRRAAFAGGWRRARSSGRTDLSNL